MKKILFVAALAVASAVSAADFRVGFARTDITPPLGIYMPGYYQERYAKSVLDPLQVNCVAFSDGKTTALVMQFDTEALSDSVADKMRDAISKETGVRRDAIMLHASHTHDGGFLAANVGGKGVKPLTALYVDMSTTRATDAAVEAIRDLRPASLSFARTEAKRISFGRRYRMKNGKVYTNPGVKNPDIVGPDGNPPDETVQVLRIDREEGMPICLINFQTHPDVVGKETITADWPGLTRTVFEAATMGHALCMVINGTQGDVNHVNVMPLPGEENGLENDFDNVPRGYDHAWHMANVLAGAALSVWMKCAPMRAGEIRTGTTTVRVGSQRAKSPEELALAKKYWKLHQEGKDDEIPFKHMELTTEVARAGRIVRLENGPDYFDLPLIAIAIGDSVAFGGFPGEPFNDIGKAVKKASPFRLTILSCLTNGSRGYFPFSDSYVGGGYESATSPFAPEVADKLIDGQLGLLKSLIGK
ncbi:MAG: hypothetical protein IKE55_07850 [Kiritimatiellae bacterium]|nr:hypothetical protein [Kiritimatiellia bacterium]